MQPSGTPLHVRPGRDITTFPFPPSLKGKILTAGFKDTRDFEGYRPSELAKGIFFLKIQNIQIVFANSPFDAIPPPL